MDPSIPAWTSDELDSSDGPAIEPAYFDHALGAWVLSRHADILAAFRSSKLFPKGNKGGTVKPADEEAHLKMRQETLAELSPTRLRAWRETLAPAASALANALPVEREVDLLGDYARPLCLSLAQIVTGISRSEAEELQDSARRISAAAAEPYDQGLKEAAKYAQSEIESHFPEGSTGLRDSGFVALAETMPSLLANAWFALLRHPKEWGLLHEFPELIEQGIEELLRYAGLVRTVFRTATADVMLGDIVIRQGELVVLRVVAGNRDPDQFEAANQVDVMRRGGGHFALGAGSHSCAGASLIRMAATTITDPLVRKFSAAKLIDTVQWRGGSGFRTPKALRVFLSEE